MNELTKIDKTTDPAPIQDQLAAFAQRMKVRREPGEPIAVIGENFDEKLASRGFPARHRARLSEGMVGPSLEKAKELLPRLIVGDCLLLLVGNRGPGKTQMSTWWANERLKAGKFAGYYRKTADIITEIKTTWHDGGKTVGTEDDVLKKYRKTEYLVLDEFHEKGSSDWEARTLINILDHRYDSMLATVIIANMTEVEVRQQINPSIVSRAEETGGLVVCDWPSYRTK